MNATRLITSFATAAVVAGSIGLAYAQSSDSTTAPKTDAVPAQTEAAPMTHPAMPADQSAQPAGNMGSSDASTNANSTPMDNSSMTPSTADAPAERPAQADRN